MVVLLSVSVPEDGAPLAASIVMVPLVVTRVTGSVKLLATVRLMKSSVPPPLTCRRPVLTEESGEAAWPATCITAPFSIRIVPALESGILSTVVIEKVPPVKSSVTPELTNKLSIETSVEQVTVYGAPVASMRTSSAGIGTAPVLHFVGSSQFPLMGLVQWTGPCKSTVKINGGTTT